MAPPTETKSIGTGRSGSRLLNLPAELRNRIYYLALTTDADTDQWIDLFKAAGPTKSLLLTCSQVYAEAGGVHKAAYRRYWRTGRFVLLQSSIAASFAAAKTAIKELRTEDVNNITCIGCGGIASFIYRLGPGLGHTCYTKMLEGNAWVYRTYSSIVDTQPSRESYTVFTRDHAIPILRSAEAVEAFMARLSPVLRPLKWQICRMLYWADEMR